ncbi:MAG: prepilin-type N-terminal cleavage/methylation domain-containing protein [Thiobacillus sp.]
MLIRISNQQDRQRGLSLVEMMVSLTVGMIVVSGALVLAVSSMASSRDNIRMSFLNQEMRNVINLMTNDLRRASSWGGALDATRVSSVSTLTFSSNTSGASATIPLSFDSSDVSDTLVDSLGARAIGATLMYLDGSNKYTATISAYDAGSNTFTATLNTAFPDTVLASKGGVAKGGWGLLAPESAVVTASLMGNDCAIFSYDLDANGLIDNSERMGFRYDATNKAVEMRKGGTDCSGDDWENVTDEKTIDIMSFTIEDQSPGVLSAGNFDVNIRQYSIEMKGRLKSDNSIERYLRETIRVRNDRVS